MRISIALAAVLTVVTAALAADPARAATDDYRSPFQEKEADRAYFRPVGSYTLGFSSFKTGSLKLVQGPSAGLAYFLEDSAGVWLFVADSHFSLLSGLGEGMGGFFSGAIGGGRFLESLKRELILAAEYRHSFGKSVDSIAVLRLGLTPEPGSTDNFGFEIQYTSFSRTAGMKQLSYPTTFFVVRYYF